MTRRNLITASLCAATTACGPAGPPPRPNILLVISDDQSWNDAGAYGARHVATPAFDRVAREGLLFTNSFTASPSCTPSRSAVLMGRHVWQQGEAGVLYGAIPPSIPLYPHLLEDAGYAIGYTGKGWAPGDFKALGLTRNPCGKEYNAKRHAEPVRPGIEPSDYAENFRQFLGEKPKDKPFCFWLGSKEPHRVYDVGSGLRFGKKLEDAQVPPYLPDTPAVRSDLLDYYLEIEWYDQQLARTLRILEETSQLENTLIVVTSDNGMPFPRAKVSLYDAGLRMPLAVRWGDRLKRGATVETLVSHTDLAPTFLEAAGVKRPESMAGQSLLPILENRPFPREQVFSAMERHTMCRPDGQGYPMRSLRTADYRYIRNYAPDRWPTGGDFLSSNKTTHGDIDGGPVKDSLLHPATRAKFPHQVALCLNRRPAEELYELRSDPHQLRNLAVDPRHQATLSDLRTRLDTYLKQTGDPRVDGKDPWQSYVYRQTNGYGASFNVSLPESVREAARVKVHKPE
jgi:N-sulfoglucosamine sulfohydrolase